MVDRSPYLDVNMLYLKCNDRYKYYGTCLYAGETSVLEDLFGNSTLVKTIDFLLENRFRDYTKTDIANHSGVSRTQLYRIWNAIVENNLVKESRKIAATTLYRTNLDSPIVKSLENLSLTIADEKNRRILEPDIEKMPNTSINPKSADRELVSIDRMKR